MDLRKIENGFYTLALRIAAQPTPQTTTTSKAPTATPPADADTTKVASEPIKGKEVSKEKEVAKDKEIEHSKPPPAVKINPPPSTSSEDIIA